MPQPDSKWDRLKDLFAAASAVPPEEREAFLRERGVGDATMREVLDLLGASSPLEEQAGDLIGPYKLLECLGEGGFGTVWMAEQRAPIQRLVAVKILKAGMDSAQVLARFEQERQALALMQHPHIAQVYDAGTTPRGRPFFVMELVKGVPITEYAARERLTVNGRLLLFVQVCRAVQHAHQKGVIHRDIKPRNVLVVTADGRPLAKVIDFGIAKATAGRLTERTLFTEHRAMVGTLEYMSPEQAEGLLDVDTRADVYSLGALLYELLTGGTPFDASKLLAAGFGEMLRVLREVEPERPSVRVSSKAGAGWVAGGSLGSRDPKVLFGSLRGDLDWVVMKALEKDRGRRYGSADDLVLDIERHLGGEPVMAAPPSKTYRLRKFASKNRSLVASTLAVGAATAVGLILAVHYWTTAQFERQESTRAQEQMHLAQDAARLDNYLSRVRASMENARVGNRQQALTALERCEPSLREWEWRYARAMADDTVRFSIEDCTAWAADASGERVAIVGKSGGRLLHTKTGKIAPLLGEPQLQSTTGPMPEGAVPMFLADGWTLVIHAARMVGAIDLRQGAWLHRTPVEEGHHTAIAARSESWVACDPNGHILCRRQRDGDVIWQTQTEAAGALDMLVDRDENVVVVLFGAETRRCLGLALENGTQEWISPALTEPGAGSAAGAVAAPPPDRLLLPPSRQHVVALASDAFYERENMCAMSMIDVRTGLHVPGMASTLGIVRSACGTLSTGCNVSMDEETKRGAWSLSWRLALRSKVVVDELACEWSVEPETGELSALGDLNGSPLLCVGQADDNWWAPEVMDCGLYPNGLNDVSTATWEWRTHPRQWAGMPRGRVGASYLCGILDDHSKPSRLLLVPDRPHDTFPPAPMGLECSVAALGSWHGTPSAIYPGGVTILDCNVAARTPVDAIQTPIAATAFDAHGMHVVFATNGALQTRATADGETMGPNVCVEGTVLATALTHEARYVVAIIEKGDGTQDLTCFAVAEATQVGTMTVSRAPAHAPLAPVRFVLAASDQHVALAAPGEALRLFELPVLHELSLQATASQPASSAEFDASGERLAVGRPDGGIEILRLDGSLIAGMNAHLGEVTSLVWSSNDARLFSAGADGFVRLWEPRAGLEVLNLGDNTLPGLPTVRALAGAPVCLFATPDGERLFCGYSDGAVRVWDSVPWSERAKQLSPMLAPTRR